MSSDLAMPQVNSALIQGTCYCGTAFEIDAMEETITCTNCGAQINVMLRNNAALCFYAASVDQEKAYIKRMENQ